jgi:hypothetical protein
VLGSAKDTAKDSSMINVKKNYLGNLSKPTGLKNKLKDGFVMTARKIKQYATVANKRARSRLFPKKENLRLLVNLMKMKRL